MDLLDICPLRENVFSKKNKNIENNIRDNFMSTYTYEMRAAEEKGGPGERGEERRGCGRGSGRGWGEGERE